MALRQRKSARISGSLSAPVQFFLTWSYLHCTIFLMVVMLPYATVWARHNSCLWFAGASTKRPFSPDRVKEDESRRKSQLSFDRQLSSTFIHSRQLWTSLNFDESQWEFWLAWYYKLSSIRSHPRLISSFRRDKCRIKVKLQRQISYKLLSIDSRSTHSFSESHIHRMLEKVFFSHQ